MSWQRGIPTVAAVGINLYAVAALVLTWGKAGPVVRRWEHRLGWLLLAYLVLSAAFVALVVRSAASALESADPSMRAAQLAQVISEGMNCGFLVGLGLEVPLTVVLWLWWKGRRGVR